MSKTQDRKYLKKLYNLHAWVGFQLAIVMFIILLTGTIATVSNEIDWLIFDEMRATSATRDNTNNGVSSLTPQWSNLYKASTDYAPDAKIKSISTMGSDYFTYRVRAQFEDGKDRFIQVDQFTNVAKGDIPLLTVQRFFRDLHRYLFMPNYLGLPTVTFFAFILAISLYTGLKTTRNWKTAISRLRLNQGPRILLSDLHKVLGLWGIWFVVVIVLTSLWYLFEFGAAAAGNRFEPAPPKLEQTVSEDYGKPMTVKQFSEAVEVAQSAIEDWNITSVQFPNSPTGTLRFKGVGSNPLLRDRAHKVDIDPVTLDIIAVQFPKNMSWANYINEYADPLHFGYFGGLTTKLIWFVFGLGLTGLSVTGVMMTWKRTKQSAMTTVQIRTLPILALSAFFFFFWLQRFL